MSLDEAMTAIVNAADEDAAATCAPHCRHAPCAASPI